ALLPEHPHWEEDDLEIQESLAIREPRIGLSALEGAEQLLDRSFARRSIAVQLQAELDYLSQISLIEGHLPIVADPRPLSQERLEEVGMKVAPGARNLFVEPASQGGESAERKPAGAGVGEAAGHVTGTVGEQRQHPTAK